MSEKNLSIKPVSSLITNNIMFLQSSEQPIKGSNAQCNLVLTLDDTAINFNIDDMTNLKAVIPLTNIEIEKATSNNQNSNENNNENDEVELDEQNEIKEISDKIETEDNDLIIEPVENLATNDEETNDEDDSLTITDIEESYNDNLTNNVITNNNSQNQQVEITQIIGTAGSDNLSIPTTNNYFNMDGLAGFDTVLTDRTDFDFRSSENSFSNMEKIVMNSTNNQSVTLDADSVRELLNGNTETNAFGVIDTTKSLLVTAAANPSINNVNVVGTWNDQFTPTLIGTTNYEVYKHSTSDLELWILDDITPTFI